MKKLFITLSLVLSSLFLLTGCGGSGGDKKDNVVYVYSWGDYLDQETLKIFEKETGIHVVLDEFDTNESMFPRVAEGAVHYDVICPSDYMIQKLIDNDLIQPLDFTKLENAKKNIGEEFFKQAETFDPGNKYSVPYCWGTVGIIYDKTKVTEPVDSWNILWNEKYAGQILMQDSARDAMMIPLKLMGKSMNETDKAVLAQETKAARASLRYRRGQGKAHQLGGGNGRCLFGRGSDYFAGKSEHGVCNPEGRHELLD